MRVTHTTKVRADRSRKSIILTLSDARRLTSSNSPRLRCRSYNVPSLLLPNGSLRTTPLVADALLEIGEVFLVTARFLRKGPGQPANFLQMDQVALDMATGRLVLMPPYGASAFSALPMMPCLHSISSRKRTAKLGKRKTNGIIASGTFAKYYARGWVDHR